MKPDYQVLTSQKDPTPLLKKWRGGKASLWGYTVSHRVLEIRIELEGTDDYMSIYCGDVRYLGGPKKWNDSHFELEHTDGCEIILHDKPAGFEVRAGVVGAKEKPYA